jgi:hypothetical protein
MRRAGRAFALGAGFGGASWASVAPIESEESFMAKIKMRRRSMTIVLAGREFAAHYPTA